MFRLRRKIIVPNPSAPKKNNLEQNNYPQLSRQEQGCKVGMPFSSSFPGRLNFFGNYKVPELVGDSIQSDNLENKKENIVAIKYFANNLYEILSAHMNDEPIQTPAVLLHPDGSNAEDCQNMLQVFNNKFAVSINDIVRVDSQFKKLYSLNFELKDTHIQLNETIQLFLDQYHDKIASIKLADLQKQTCYPAGVLMRMTLKNKEKYTFLLRGKEKKNACDCFNNLFDLLPGNKMESTLRSAARKVIKTNIDWGGTWESGSKAKFYDSSSDPVILQKILTHIMNKHNENGPLQIMDLGGGKGRLARKILLLAQRVNVPIHLILLEPEKKQCQTAMSILNATKKQFGPAFFSKVSIYNMTVEEFFNSKFYEEYAGKLQGVVSSGGPLNLQIVDYDTAMLNFKIVKNLLDEKGMLIASGATDLAFTGKTMQKYGFDILNRMETFIFSDKEERKKEKKKTCYVLEKNTPIPTYDNQMKLR